MIELLEWLFIVYFIGIIICYYWIQQDEELKTPPDSYSIFNAWVVYLVASLIWPMIVGLHYYIITRDFIRKIKRNIALNTLRNKPGLSKEDKVVIETIIKNLKKLR